MIPGPGPSPQAAPVPAAALSPAAYVGVSFVPGDATDAQGTALLRADPAA